MYYEKHIGYKTKADVFKRNAVELGRFRVDQNFPAVYYDYIHRISESRAVNTVNNYRICIRSVLNFYVDKIIEKHFLSDFGLEPMVERDRIWTPDEKLRIYNAMAECDSHLYWSVRFAEKNPIRHA
jgi:hypothetical protein